MVNDLLKLFYPLLGGGSFILPNVILCTIKNIIDLTGFEFGSSILYFMLAMKSLLTRILVKRILFITSLLFFFKSNTVVNSIWSCKAGKTKELVCIYGGGVHSFLLPNKWQESVIVKRDGLHNLWKIYFGLFFFFNFGIYEHIFPTFYFHEVGWSNHCLYPSFPSSYNRKEIQQMRNYFFILYLKKLFWG